MKPAEPILGELVIQGINSLLFHLQEKTSSCALSQVFPNALGVFYFNRN